ncbi:L-lactate permease [Corynebacterium sp. HMSC072D12]|uniref:L-lactate permease n=1 Tax=Corynebacterium sp. HMSC072D12 TaxID=1739447 RepID=UPI0008A61B05|nr:L-lactate permease [Corynebacterium sp. HMSC072D12]OFQ33314.1 L-lactate permease [Corynebacterium sp. HMSC072D12]
MSTFNITTDAIAGNIGLTALVSTLPLIAFFIMLLGLKARAHTSGAVALLVAVLIAIFGMGMPTGMALSSAVRGGLFGLFPIVWVIITAIWFYEVTVASGRFNDLRKTFDLLGDGDIRIQAILIAFCFGGLLEALAGFGAPVAITATMILALGVKPLKAATTVLIANTAPVAFGAVGIPVTTAGSVGGRTAEQTADIAGLISLQVLLIAAVVPFFILFILDGMRGVKEAGPAAAVIGISFAIAQWAAATFFAYQLTNVVACIVSLGAGFLFLRVWKPKGVDSLRERMELPAQEEVTDLNGSRIWMALLPYAVVTAVFAIATAWPSIFSFLQLNVAWPLLEGTVFDAEGHAMDTAFKFNVLGNPGTLLLISGIIVAVIYMSFNENGRYTLEASAPLAKFGEVISRMKFSALTIILVLALAYTMNYSGQTISIGQFVASVGGIFALFSPVLGWIGTAVTGSDTSANALFANLQVTAAERIGVNPDLMLAANTSGGVVGKMISPQSLAIAATAVQMEGEESRIFKAVVGYSVAFLAVVCIIVFLMTNVLGFLVP